MSFIVCNKVELMIDYRLWYLLKKEKKVVIFKNFLVKLCFKN